MNWPDAEVMVIGWLRDRGMDARDELDNDLLDELPVVRVNRIPGGGDDGFRLDQAFMDIDVFAATSDAASALSREIRRLFLAELRGSEITEAVIGAVTTVSPPARRPYENTGLRRHGATYSIYFHPVP